MTPLQRWKFWRIIWWLSLVLVVAYPIGFVLSLVYDSVLPMLIGMAIMFGVWIPNLTIISSKLVNAESAVGKL